MTKPLVREELIAEEIIKLKINALQYAINNKDEIKLKITALEYAINNKEEGIYRDLIVNLSLESDNNLESTFIN